MAEYFGYVPRDISKTTVDWAEAGKKLADTVGGVVDKRVEKKRAIEQAKNDFLQKISNIPQGMDEEYNEWAMTGGNNIKNGLLQMYYLLRANKVKPEDYQLIVQNSNSGVDRLVGVVNDYNKNYEERAVRKLNNKSHPLEQYFTEQVDGFANFKQSEITFDPLTGTVGLQKYDENGNPVGQSNLNTVNQRINVTIDRLNTDDMIAKQLQDVAQKYQLVDETGKLLTIDAITQHERWASVYPQLRRDLVQDPMFGSQVLVEAFGYYLTEDENDTDPKAIHLKDAGNGVAVPDLSDGQLKVVDGYVRDQMDAQLGRVETPKPEKTPVGPTTAQTNAQIREASITSALNRAMEIGGILNTPNWWQDANNVREIGNYINRLSDASGANTRFFLDPATHQIFRQRSDGLNGWITDPQPLQPNPNNPEGWASDIMSIEGYDDADVTGSTYGTTSTGSANPQNNINPTPTPASPTAVSSTQDWNTAVTHITQLNSAVGRNNQKVMPSTWNSSSARTAIDEIFRNSTNANHLQQGKTNDWSLENTGDRRTQEYTLWAEVDGQRVYEQVIPLSAGKMDIAEFNKYIKAMLNAVRYAP